MHCSSGCHGRHFFLSRGSTRPLPRGFQLLQIRPLAFPRFHLLSPYLSLFSFYRHFSLPFALCFRPLTVIADWPSFFFSPSISLALSKYIGKSPVGHRIPPLSTSPSSSLPFSQPKLQHVSPTPPMPHRQKSGASLRVHAYTYI